MSRRNGDRSRFQINRKRKLRHRERIRALLSAAAGRESVAAPGELRADTKATKRG